MSFIDQIKKRKETEGTEVTKPNPFAGRKNPLAGKNPLAAKKPDPKPPVEEVKTEAPVEEAAVETAMEEAVVATEEVITEATETPEQSAADAAQEMNSEEVMTEEDAKEEAIANGEPEEAKSEAPVEEAEPKEEPKKKPSRSRAKPKADKKTEAAPATEAAEFYAIPTTELTSFAEVLEAIKTPFEDAEWESFKQEVTEDLANITIADDLNPGMLKVTLSELAMVREKLWLPLQEAKNEYERFTSKEPEGIIERVKRVNSVGGSNDTERRRAGVMACMNYETPMGSVNLYEALDDVRQRYNFLKAAMDSVKFKSDILITMNGALKLESSM